MNLRALLSERVAEALAVSGAPDAPAIIQPAAKAEFGDYQANGVMGAAKRLGIKPRELAQRVIDHLAIDDIAKDVSIAGPGFINISLRDEWLAEQAGANALITPTVSPRRIVVDYSSPNLAKEMHVGHLRSTIIGDAIARVLQALGQVVIRQNHVGDWGTQFGMLVMQLDGLDVAEQELADLEDFYRKAKAHFDADPKFADQARLAVVALQSGDAATLALWQQFIDISLGHCQMVYDRLGVTLTRADVHAESAYNNELPGIITRLQAQGLLTTDQGAACVFLDEFKRKDGTVLPIIVQKSDGGYLYATTDLASIDYRSNQLHADRVLYLVDERQSLHFRQVFALAKRAGFTNDNVDLNHLPFGKMLGKDGRPFQTRAGGVVKLTDLLDEAEARALKLVQQKSPELDAQTHRSIATAVGVGAVKYADLSKNRTSDYVFDWDQMIAFEGDTAPYLQYAYTRIRSVFRKGQIDPEQLSGNIVLEHPSERALALALCRFQEVLEQVGKDGYPHYLCGYLYELAVRYSQFYEACPILNAPDAEKNSRLLLCRRTAQTLQTGLDLLGITTVEQM